MIIGSILKEFCERMRDSAYWHDNLQNRALRKKIRLTCIIIEEFLLGIWWFYGNSFYFNDEA
jgi:hypothetical protein